MRAAEVSQNPPVSHVAIFLHYAGAEALRIYNTFTFEEDENKNTVDTVLVKYNSYCQPIETSLFLNAINSGRKNQYQKTSKNCEVCLVWSSTCLISFQVSPPSYHHFQVCWKKM